MHGVLRARGRRGLAAARRAVGPGRRARARCVLHAVPARAHGVRLAGGLGYRGLVDFARFGLLPVRRLADEEFRGDGGPRMIAGNALHADFSPEQPGGAVFGWVLCSLAQRVGYPIPEGGSSALSPRWCGVCNPWVAACGAPPAPRPSRCATAGPAACARTHGDLVGPPRRPRRRRRAAALPRAPAARARSRTASCGRSTASNGASRRSSSTSRSTAPCPGLHPDTGRAGTVHIAEGIDALTRAMAEIVLRRIPAEPFLVSGQYAQADPTRMPPGKEVLWAYTHVPRCVERDAGPDGLTGELRTRRSARASPTGCSTRSRRSPPASAGRCSPATSRRPRPAGGEREPGRRRAQRRDRAAASGARLPPDPRARSQRDAGRRRLPRLCVRLSHRGRPRRLRRQRGALRAARARRPGARCGRDDARAVGTPVTRLVTRHAVGVPVKAGRGARR